MSETTSSNPITETKPIARLGPWEISNIDFGIFVCMSITMIYIGTTIGFRMTDWIPALSGIGKEDLLGIILGGYGLQIGTVIAFVSFAFLMPSKKTNRPVGTGKAIGIGLIGLVVAYCVLIAFIPGWKLLLNALSIPIEFQEPVKLVLQGGSRWEMISMYILIVVGAPIGEELFFRAGIFRFLNSRMNMTVAAVISSLAFGIVHYNLYSFGPLVILGIAMCIVYHKSGNLVSSITLHASFNLINLIAISVTDITDLV